MKLHHIKEESMLCLHKSGTRQQCHDILNKQQAKIAWAQDVAKEKFGKAVPLSSSLFSTGEASPSASLHLTCPHLNVSVQGTVRAGKAIVE